jgi:hypothetical protein
MEAKDLSIKEYLSGIGRKGGVTSRRRLSPEDARNMVRVREARRALRDFHAQCFWYLRSDLEVTLEDLPEIVRGLRQHGGRQGFLRAAKLCR